VIYTIKIVPGYFLLVYNVKISILPVKKQQAQSGSYLTTFQYNDFSYVTARLEVRYESTIMFRNHWIQGLSEGRGAKGAICPQICKIKKILAFFDKNNGMRKKFINENYACITPQRRV
jgi:hypothetical protein